MGIVCESQKVLLKGHPSLPCLTVRDAIDAPCTYQGFGVLGATPTVHGMGGVTPTQHSSVCSPERGLEAQAACLMWVGLVRG